MAVKSWNELKSYVQQYFLENYDEEITAEQLRVILIDLIDSTSMYIQSNEGQIRKGTVNVLTSGTVVTFDTPFADTNYVVIGNCFASNNLVLHSEYDFTTVSFKVKPAINGRFKYVAFPF
jgi:hypothetical protein